MTRCYYLVFNHCIFKSGSGLIAVVKKQTVNKKRRATASRQELDLLNSQLRYLRKQNLFLRTIVSKNGITAI